MNQEYSVIITAHVTNNPSDDNFEYTFDFNGSLPEGIELIKEPDNRRIILQGTPIELDSFEFILKAKVDDEYDPFEGDDPGETFLIEATYLIAEGVACENNYEHEQSFTINVLLM